MKLKHPGITGTQRIDAGGNQYYADEDGVIEVPDALVDNLERVGWVALDRPVIPMVQVEVAEQLATDHAEVIDEPADEPADEEALVVEPEAAAVVEEPEA